VRCSPKCDGIKSQNQSQADAQLGFGIGWTMLMQLCGLSEMPPWADETLVWSGFGQMTMSAAADPKANQPYTIEKDGFRATFFAMVGQYGTHVDPGRRIFDPNGITDGLDPLEQMILPLVVFEDTKYFDHGPNHRLTVEDAREW
jgi:kynurenine formamidase